MEKDVLIIGGHTCTSVSYTHLDVYKRQEETVAVSTLRT